MSKPKGPTIQECPAYAICREKGVGCEVCLELPEEAWKEQVRKVLVPDLSLARHMGRV